jgi:predicted transcriptional regulator
MRTLLLLLSIASQTLFALGVGQSLPEATLLQANGSAWHSTSLRGQKHLVIYMDPDKRKNIQPLLKALQASPKSIRTVAIVNLAATWMPNKVLMSKLKKNQGKMKNTHYVFDKKRTLVKAWGLADNDTEVLVLDRNGKLLYRKHGALNRALIETILKKF